MKKTQDQLDHIRTKYNITESQLEQESQQPESDDDDNNDDSNIGLIAGGNKGEETVMSDLTESGKVSCNIRWFGINDA